MSKNILTTTILAVAIIAIGTLVYLAINQSSQTQQGQETREINEEAPITKSIDTSNWKTYRNEEYGFELKVPSLWQARINSGTGSKIFSVVFSRESLSEKDIFQQDPLLIVYAGSTTSRGLECWKKLSEEVIEIDGVKANKAIFSSENSVTEKAVSCDFPQTAKMFLIDFSNNGIEYSLEFFTKNPQKDEAILNQILSTFKFLEAKSEESGVGYNNQLLILDATFEKITDDFNSPDFMDRKLVIVKSNGQREIIISKVKEFLGWKKIPGEETFYPKKVSFAPSYSKLFFVKYFGGTGHSSGFYSLDLKTLKVKELKNVARIYEDYLNYKSIVSPDGTKIASLGYDSLYILDLLSDTANILIKAKDDEIFFAGQQLSDFEWLDNRTIRYPVYSKGDLQTPTAMRQISLIGLQDSTTENEYFVSPSKGDVWKIGEEHTIILRKPIKKPNSIVDLKLYDAETNQFIGYIAWKITNTPEGISRIEFPWDTKEVLRFTGAANVPAEERIRKISPGRYKILIEETNLQGEVTVLGESDEFLIVR